MSHKLRPNLKVQFKKGIAPAIFIIIKFIKKNIKEKLFQPFSQIKKMKSIICIALLALTVSANLKAGDIYNCTQKCLDTCGKNADGCDNLRI